MKVLFCVTVVAVLCTPSGPFTGAFPVLFRSASSQVYWAELAIVDV